MAAGAAYGIRPAGMLALDVVRLEAGLILLEVDYTSARHAMNPEQNYSPVRDRARAARQLRQGRLRRPAGARARGARRAVRRDGSSASQLDWYEIEGLFSAQGLPPAISPGRRPVAACRSSCGGSPGRPGDEPRLEPDPQAGDRARVGAAAHEPLGSKLDVEWTVEGRRGRVAATVVDLPFLDLPRKRA